VVVAAILTWAFSSSDNPHYVLLIGVFAVAAFLVMEANRYREYDVWRDRVRTIQTDVIAEQYDPSETPSREWRRNSPSNSAHRRSLCPSAGPWLTGSVGPTSTCC